MKVKMRTTAAGPEGVQLAGQIYDLPDAAAKAYVNAGSAEAIDKPKPARQRPARPPVERATANPDAETADARP